MTIAIDASRAVRPNPTGIELYSLRLIEHLAKIKTDHRFILYSPTQPPKGFPNLHKNWEWRVIPFPRLWTQLRLPLALLIDKPDLLFVPAHVLPLFCPVPTVTTIHDLASEIFPELYSWFQRWYNHWSVRQAITKAAAIITPSQSTRQDLIKLFQAPADPVTAIHLGYDPIAEPRRNELPKEIDELGQFFLMIGRLEKRKNTARAIEAFGRFRQLKPDLTAKLVLIGKPGYGYEEIKATLAALPADIAADVIETGYLSEKETATYRATATAFLYPSLYEGFGLPLLEAMAAGTPIITSDVASIPEVVDDAAILVDPHKIEEIAQAMAILASNELSGQEIAKRGKERVKAFSWEKTAQETLAVFEEVIKEKA